MTKPTCVTLFSGGGLKAIGAMSAGFKLVGAVEYDETIAAVYRQNLGPNVTVGKVEETDPTPYIGITALLASPVCTRISIANANRGETDVDIIAAEGVCHWLRVTKPKIFVCENVPQYRASVSCKMIETCLSELGYFYTADNINCADFGVPQSRRRLIIRALLGSMVPALPSPEPHIGWYAAIEDLIPTLPESKFADWQLKRLPALWTDTLVRNGNSSVEKRPVDVSGSRVHSVEAPSPTPCISTGIVLRAFLVEGDVAGDKSITPPMALLMESKFPTRNGKKMYRETAQPTSTVTSLDPNWKALLIESESVIVSPMDGRLFPATQPAPTVMASDHCISPRALLIEGDAAGDRPPTCGTSAEPCFTLKTLSGGRVHRAFLTDGFNASRDATVRVADDPAMTIAANAMRRPSSTAQAFIVDGQQTLPVHGGGRTASVRHESQPVQTVTATSYKGMAKAFIVSDQTDGAGKGCGIRQGDEPSATVRANSGGGTAPRAWLAQGRVVSMTPRALGRFMTLPDWYVLPEKKTLASKIIGNGFPCLAAEKILRQLLEAL